MSIGMSMRKDIFNETGMKASCRCLGYCRGCSCNVLYSVTFKTESDCEKAGDFAKSLADKYTNLSDDKIGIVLDWN